MNGTCPNCGKPLSPDAVQGLCPDCMFALGAASQTDTEDGAGAHGAKSVRPPPAKPEEIAKHFPQLEILECMGRGGMGVVYKARQPRLDRLVALKILAPEREQDPKFAERFAREAKALARLNHPNIVTVHDFGEADGMFYLLMEYVDGMTLRQLLQTRKIAPEEALNIVPRICEALQFAHELGVVHRDIKPENVLLDTQGRVKIADFGIAKIVQGRDASPRRPGEDEMTAGSAVPTGLTEEGKVMGTPHYMAPEQVEHPQKVDHRADIYSLGVVFYEMLTGELPLGKFAPPSRRVHVDVRLDEVVLHALEKEPERRYQHASEVKSAVETIAADVKSEVRNPKSEDVQSLLTSAASTVEMRFSRVAIWGVVWLGVAAVAHVWNYTPPGWAFNQALRSVLGDFLAGGLEALLLVVAFAAPVGVTALGWLATNEIRRSSGRVWGLGLALGEMVLFPVLALDVWLLWLCSQMGLKLVVGAVPALAADALLILWLWRRFQKPMPPLETAAVGPEDAIAACSSLTAQLWRVARRAALVAALDLLLLETLLQLSHDWRESTEELWTMALYSAALAAMVWAAWPLRRPPLTFFIRAGAALALFVGLSLTAAFYSWVLRPNLGLYREPAWVAQHPGFQREMRQRIEKNLWRKPAGNVTGLELQGHYGADRAPAPALAPLKSFTAADRPISTEIVSTADNAWSVSCTNTRTFQLFEVPNPGVEQCTLMYAAALKTEGLAGRAYLEMWCRFPGQGEFFSRGLDNPVTGSKDWTTCQTPFFLKAGEKPDLVRLNLVVEGPGKVLVRDVALAKAPPN